MDDIFVVRPHGSERLRASSTTYTVGTILYNSPVTQTGGHVSFMGSDICRRPDGFLGHKVHSRHNARWYHCPVNNYYLPSTLTHMVRVICNQESLYNDLL
jgi:hypothetical protein